MANYRPARLPAGVRAFMDSGNPLPKGWFDFSNGVYFYPFFKPSGLLGFSGVSYSRASSGWTVVDGTLTEFTADAPRIIPGQGLLAEPQATNLFTHSSDFTDDAWFKQGATVTANQAVGGLNADLIETTAGSNRGLVYVLNGTPPAGNTYAISCDLYSLVDDTFTLRMRGAGANQEQQNYSVFVQGGAWARVSAIAPFSSAVDGSDLLIFIYAGEFGANEPEKGFYISRAQLEVGAGATSHIPTTTTQLTRAASSLVFDCAALGWAPDQSVIATFEDGSSVALNASAGVLTLPTNVKPYSLLIATGGHNG